MLRRSKAVKVGSISAGAFKEKRNEDLSSRLKGHVQCSEQLWETWASGPPGPLCASWAGLSYMFIYDLLYKQLYLYICVKKITDLKSSAIWG